jgi:hypothetical protein
VTFDHASGALSTRVAGVVVVVVAVVVAVRVVLYSYCPHVLQV